MHTHFNSNPVRLFGALYDLGVRGCWGRDSTPKKTVSLLSYGNQIWHMGRSWDHSLKDDAIFYDDIAYFANVKNCPTLTCLKGF